METLQHSAVHRLTGFLVKEFNLYQNKKQAKNYNEDDGDIVKNLLLFIYNLATHSDTVIFQGSLQRHLII